MTQTHQGLTVLDWPVLVRDAVEMRKLLGLSQRELAAIAGISHPTVVKFEKGTTEIKVSVVLAILGVLGMDKP